MVDLFHHILIFHYTMNQKFDLRPLYMVASYVTLAIADNRCGLVTENNAKQKQFSNDYYIQFHLISHKNVTERDDTVNLYQFGMVLKYVLKINHLLKCLVIEVNSMITCYMI